jgi:hypothetical protein
MVHLTTLSEGQTKKRQNIGCLLSNKLEGISKQTVMAYFKVLIRHLSGGPEEN